MRGRNLLPTTTHCQPSANESTLEPLGRSIESSQGTGRILCFKKTRPGRATVGRVLKMTAARLWWQQVATEPVWLHCYKSPCGRLIHNNTVEVNLGRQSPIVTMRAPCGWGDFFRVIGCKLGIHKAPRTAWSCRNGHHRIAKHILHSIIIIKPISVKHTRGQAGRNTQQTWWGANLAKIQQSEKSTNNES